MNEIIKISKRAIGSEEVNSVDARELYEFLESKQQFGNWIENKVVNNPFFVNNVDFIVLNNVIKNPDEAKGGRPRVNYALTIDTAKKVAMAEQTARGNEVREYFIQCEKKLKEITSGDKPIKQAIADDLKAIGDIGSFFEIPKHIIQIEAVKEIKRDYSVDLTNYLLLAPAQSNIKEQEVMLEPTELAKHIGLSSAVKMNKVLSEMGLQAKTKNGWAATEKANGLCVKHSWVKGGKSGYNYKWKLPAILDMYNKLAA